MDTTYAGIADLTNGSMMIDPLTGPFDLTGLRYLDGLQTFELLLTPEVVDLPAFPWALDQLHVYGFGYPNLPPFPSDLNLLDIGGSGALTGLPDLPPGLTDLSLSNLSALTILPELPDALQHLELSNMPGLLSLPTLPDVLVWLRLENIGLSTLPDLPNNIDWLSLRNVEELTALPALPPSLRLLDLFSIPNITELPELPTGLERLNIYGPGPMTSLPILPPDLLDLGFGAIPTLVNWPELPPQLTQLSFSAVPFTIVPPFPTTLGYLAVGNMPDIAHLPTLPLGLITLYISDMPDLVVLPVLPDGISEVELHNNPALSALPALPQSLVTFTMVDCDNVPCLPTVPESMQYISVYSVTIDCLPNELGEWTAADLSFDQFNICTEPCLDSGPLVGGHVFHDLNSNGLQDVGDQPLSNAIVSIEPGNRLAGTNANGSYWSSLPLGSYSLSATARCAYGQTSSPLEHVALLIEPTDQDTTLHFAITLEPDHNDMSASMTGTDPRPGFTNVIWLSVVNMGTEPLPGELLFTFDPEQEWADASIMPQSISGNVATWNLPELIPGGSWDVSVTLFTAPSTSLGTVFTSTLAIVPELPDETPVDNNATLSQIVVGSFDPNDKRVTPTMLTMAEVAAGEKLSYVIRFQNTGTAPAERVRISDLLDERLHWSSFRLVASSHPCSWTMEEGLLTFDFFPILLPDSTSDEPGSHGYIRFEILPSSSVSIGDLVPNAASIFFDYNPAILTNMAVVGIEVQQEVVSSRPRASLLLYPNPACDRFWFGSSSQAVGIQRVELFAMDGRLMMMRPAPFPEKFLWVGDLAQGVYSLRVTDAQGIHTSSLMIERK